MTRNEWPIKINSSKGAFLRPSVANFLCTITKKKDIDRCIALCIPHRGVLLSPMALRLFNLYLEGICRMGNDHDLLTELCLAVDFALPRLQRSERKTLITSACNGEKVVCQGITSGYNEITRLFGCLGHPNNAEKSDKKSEKWGSNTVRQKSSQRSNFTATEIAYYIPSASYDSTDQHHKESIYADLAE
ncbi:hypothetical protein BCR41DRAFT_413832 [Lobosporangium transversale]|uniref:Uncharacterized protein n=1 Tax=Lobosporangium transversale TaxID=64571 RepID=A0A1Y2GB43_9FUNG|nr:hypothetical protein BCR41DRAFT_413832 [Lobosporangium transversale]ORZ04971.1 hypothetical protein BCR41DRAFT_413832 [Lobosporangium transversale]|eukprot:XP_021876835.1 hypothetical protein BCR41DRAFT_413832 [Lobosporangium transversale]